MAKELFLYTNGACFLCFQEPLTDTENFLSEVSLLSICRYLDIHPSSIPEEAFKENVLLEEMENRVQSLREKCKFSVTMCSTCSSLTTKLTDLINQMELIKNLLSHQLQVFHRTINEADQNSETSDLHKNRIKKVAELGNSSMVEINLVKTLRAIINQKCSNEVTNAVASSLPKVILKRVKTEHQKEMTTPSGDVDLVGNVIAPPPTISVPPDLPSSSLQLQDPLSLSPQYSPESDHESEPEIAVDPLYEPSSELKSISDISHSQKVMYISRKYSIDNITQIKCSLCDYSTTCGIAVIKTHLINSHPETLFESQLPSSMDKVTFLTTCRRLLTTETSKANKRGGGTLEKRIYPCEYCDRVINNHSNFKYHLLMKHFQIMETKLDREYLQAFNLMENRKGNVSQKIPNEDSDSMEAEVINQSDDRVNLIVPDILVGEETEASTQKKVPTSKLHGNKWICSVSDGGCGKTFTTYGNLKTHKERHCRMLGKKQFWVCDCGKCCSTSYCFRRHQENYCPKRKSKKSKNKKANSNNDDKSHKTINSDNVNVVMECSVEEVVINKIEVPDPLDS